jgi:proteasome lid subunit RPN8/RPN11
MYLLRESTLKQLSELVKLRAPMEAVGLLLPDETVVELENQSINPEDTFSLDRQQIVDALQGVEESLLDECCLWHSHPSGGVGPSRTDMQRKTPFRYHLVLTLVEDEIVPTWY